jgi:hypothetical protein
METQPGGNVVMQTGTGDTNCLAIVCADASANTGMEGAAARLPVFKSFKRSVVGILVEKIGVGHARGMSTS